MCRLNEQLALCTSVKFKAFWPTANSWFGEEIISDLMTWSWQKPDESCSCPLALSPPTFISLAVSCLFGDFLIAPILTQQGKGFNPCLACSMIKNNGGGCSVPGKKDQDS